MRRQASGPGLESVFHPRSITVVGASDDHAKWGNVLGRRALESSGGRPVLLVNRRGTPALGRPTHRTLADARDHLGEDLDLVLVCVPASQLVECVRASLAAGGRALVVISAGFSEADAAAGTPAGAGPGAGSGAGAAAEQEAVRLVREAGAVLVGPNCLGVVDTTADLQLTHDLLPPGPVTVLSQSGNVVLDLAALLEARGLGVARFVSLGNQADLTVVDLMLASVGHEGTRAVAVYVEDLVDGRAFVAAARRLRDAGKPVVLLAPGRSAAAVRSAVSHTGSLTSGSAVVDAACAAAGTHRVETPTQMADVLEGVLEPRRVAGRSTAVLTDGGGHGAIAADSLAAVGLTTPLLHPGTRADLRALLRDTSTVANPVDLAGAGEHDPVTYVQAVARLLADDEVDAVLVTGYFGGYSTHDSPMAALEIAAAHRLTDLVRAQSKPVVVHTIFPGSPTGQLLRAAGIPVHRDVDRSCAVLAALVDEPVPDEDLALPPAAPPVGGTTYAEARGLFAGAGIAFPPARTVHDGLELEAALTELTPPLVLKALGREHKSEGGGVVLGLRDEDEARAAYDLLVTALAPPAVSVEAMADTTGGVEVIVGSVLDPRFGPVLVVGLGGVLAEVLADTALAVAPVSPAAARRLLLSLRGAPLLTGARGRPPVDLDALAGLVSRFSQVAAAHPELAELELNPVHAGPAGVVALDARVVPGS